LLERLARPAPDDVRAIEAALAKVTTDQHELGALFDALASRRADGRFVDAAFTELRRLRAKIHAARADVVAIRRRSALRADVLSYLDGLDGIFATLADLGRNTDAARAARLRARSAKLQRQVDLSARAIAPALKTGKP